MSNIQLVSVCLLLLFLALALRIISIPVLDLWRRNRNLCLAWSATVLLIGMFLFRPHGDTFTALDHSGYRLMSKAFLDGRSFHEEDHMLAAMPHPLRNATMLLPNMQERNTRDRSFLVPSLENPETEPFFYPFLSLLSSGWEWLMPFSNSDFFVPFTGAIFFALLALLAVRYGKFWGLLIAIIFFFGNPLPSMLFRGFYAEAVGASLMGLAVFELLKKQTDESQQKLNWAAYMALGLCICLHPVYIVISIPLLIIGVLDPQVSLGQSIKGLTFFALGAIPLILLTELVCSPYGKIGLGQWMHNYHVSTSHRLVLVFGGITILFLVISLSTKQYWKNRIQALNKRWAWLTLLVLAVLINILALNFWKDKALVLRGLKELWASCQVPFGIFLGVASVGLWISRKHLRSKLVFIVFLATLPVFAYLKGAEQMGMWSQRRLLPALVLLILALTPWVSECMAKIQELTPKKRYMALVPAILVLSFVGFSNLIRWPAPYVTRVDHGAWPWVQSMREKIGDRLTFFDYLPYSFPFSVDNRTRAFGIGQRSTKDLPEIMDWLYSQAMDEEVLIVSAYGNPGIENNLNLEEESFESIKLKRIKSKRALPALVHTKTVEYHFLKAKAINEDSAKPVLDKVMDGGPLALRGEWGREYMRITTDTGERIPATWSREGSAVVGPVPAPGESVEITVWANSGQDTSQVMYITPPWPVDSPAELLITPNTTQKSTRISRDNTGDLQSYTGEYRINSKKPYNPALSGIKGYHDDLGVLIHRIRIECIKQ